MPKKTSEKLKAVKADRKELRGEVKRLRAKLKSARERGDTWKARAKAAETSTAPMAPESSSRTLAELREEAKQRDISGYSRMTKAQLTDALA